MATAKTTTNRTRNTTTVGAKARSKAATVDATATVDINRVRQPFYAYVGAADLAVEKIRALPEAAIRGSVQTSVKSSLKSLPNTVRDQMEALPSKAKGAYGDLVARGHKLVSTVRSNPNAKAAVQQAKTARSQAKGATTSLRRSVNSAQKVADATADKIG